MVFDHCLPSCYSSAEFAETAAHLDGNFVVAGQVGELSCLSTAVDAFHRNERPTFLTDALVTHGSRELPAAAMERALAHLLSFYVDTDMAEGWIVSTSRRLKVRE